MEIKHRNPIKLSRYFQITPKVWQSKAKQSKAKQKIFMKDWLEKLDYFLEFNEYDILEDYESMQNTTNDVASKIKKTLDHNSKI
jgi:hypothetical protein